ncbi:hypothetical protein GGR88_000341 [Sphingomonas jejuensis]|uniref:Uncharacterized protein n=1 Tax=Sphingomonas jejuensis TaxID=904715 RepID=A0ABX0XJ85_9SPHN|nr:hypothetical protein [Sphingomonas jejuensis]NJC32867.1 hypothetical protein [Sphingomonas jejuensis]
MRHATTSLAALALVLVGGCQRNLEIDSSGGVSTVRSACPAVGIPAGTGDITLFNPENSRTADAIDVTASITNLRTQCGDQGDQIVSRTTFDVQAQRRDNRGARQVVLPYYASVVQGGTSVVAKRVSRVTLSFADGQYRATAQGEASGVVSRAAATIPAEIEAQITRRRRPGDADAAVDPLADPTVRQAVARASFELLVGFALTPEQLRYNVTR